MPDYRTGKNWRSASNKIRIFEPEFDMNSGFLNKIK